MKISESVKPEPEDLCGGADHGEVGVVHEGGGDQRSRVAPPRPEIGNIARRNSPPAEAADPTTRSITTEENLAVEMRDILVDEGSKRTFDAATKAIAPFECSWTDGPNDDSMWTNPKSPPQGKHPTKTPTLELACVCSSLVVSVLRSFSTLLIYLSPRNHV